VRTIGLKIICLVLCLSALKAYSSDTEEESLTYYQEGLSFYKMAEYISAEKAFLKSIEVTDTINNERFAHSFHYLGNT